MTLNFYKYFRLERVASTGTNGIEDKVVYNNLRRGDRNIDTAANLFFNGLTIQTIGNLNTTTREKTHKGIARWAVLRYCNSPRTAMIIPAKAHFFRHTLYG